MCAPAPSEPGAGVGRASVGLNSAPLTPSCCRVLSNSDSCPQTFMVPKTEKKVIPLKAGRESQAFAAFLAEKLKVF